MNKSILFSFKILFSVAFVLNIGSVMSAEAPAAVKAEKGFSNKNCLVKCPDGTPMSNTVVDNDAIILSSNLETKFADWVAYLSLSTYLDGPSRDRNWAQDPEINERYTFIPSDYRGFSGSPFLFDRGHQAPLGSFRGHPKWFVVNYLSNITPQKRDLNQGSWRNLENAERVVVKKYGQAYVMTGPYYDKNNRVEGPPVQRMSYVVPSGYWKIIALQEKEGKIHVACFIFSQMTPRGENYCTKMVPLARIEQATGLKFFGGAPTLESPTLKSDIGCGDSQNAMPQQVGTP